MEFPTHTHTHKHPSNEANKHVAFVGGVVVVVIVVDNTVDDDGLGAAAATERLPHGRECCCTKRRFEHAGVGAGFHRKNDLTLTLVDSYSTHTDKKEPTPRFWGAGWRQFLRTCMCEKTHKFQYSVA